MQQQRELLNQPISLCRISSGSTPCCLSTRRKSRTSKMGNSNKNRTPEQCPFKRRVVAFMTMDASSWSEDEALQGNCPILHMVMVNHCWARTWVSLRTICAAIEAEVSTAARPRRTSSSSCSTVETGHTLKHRRYHQSNWPKILTMSPFSSEDSPASGIVTTHSTGR